jgi:ElaB/YqjD/DUF883 family membrane-anchored ribosome-binding protein
MTDNAKSAIELICNQATHAVNELRKHLENAEALLADERERVATLQKRVAELEADIANAQKRAKDYCPDYPWHLGTASEVMWALGAGRKGVLSANDDLHKMLKEKDQQIADLERRLPTEKTVQAICNEFFSQSGSLESIVRRHLLHAQPAPQRDPPTVIEFCMRTDEAEALKRIADKQELTEQQVLRQALRLYETTVFPVESIPKLQPAPQPEPLPDGVWLDNRHGFFRRHPNDWDIKYAHQFNEYKDFVEKWHPRRHEFPDKPPQPERDEVMRILDETSELSEHMIDGGAVKVRIDKLRELIQSERAGRKGVPT